MEPSAPCASSYGHAGSSPTLSLPDAFSSITESHFQAHWAVLAMLILYPRLIWTNLRLMLMSLRLKLFAHYCILSTLGILLDSVRKETSDPGLTAQL